MKIEFNDADTPAEHAAKIEKLNQLDRQQQRKRRSEALDAIEPFVLALVGAVTIGEADNIVFQAFGVAALLLAVRRFLKG